MNDGKVPVRCGNVAVVVLRGEGDDANVLLMRRSKGPLAGLWCQVTGKVEEGETAWQAALRTAWKCFRYSLPQSLTIPRCS